MRTVRVYPFVLALGAVAWLGLLPATPATAIHEFCPDYLPLEDENVGSVAPGASVWYAEAWADSAAPGPQPALFTLVIELYSADADLYLWHSTCDLVQCASEDHVFPYDLCTTGDCCGPLVIEVRHHASPLGTDVPYWLRVCLDGGILLGSCF